MNWDAVGAISQIVGAVLVGITLIYLAVQLRQNTSALKSSTFLAISASMGSTMEVWATHSDLAPLLIKAQEGTILILTRGVLIRSRGDVADILRSASKRSP
jgi:hypothetical protein